MAHKPKAKVFVIRRTNMEDPKDTRLIDGAPRGHTLNRYPNFQTFITSDGRVADQYAAEMAVDFGHRNTYEVETREVRV